MSTTGTSPAPWRMFYIQSGRRLPPLVYPPPTVERWISPFDGGCRCSGEGIEPPLWGEMSEPYVGQPHPQVDIFSLVFSVLNWSPCARNGAYSEGWCKSIQYILLSIFSRQFVNLFLPSQSQGKWDPRLVMSSVSFCMQWWRQTSPAAQALASKTFLGWKCVEKTFELQPIRQSIAYQY